MKKSKSIMLAIAPLIGAILACGGGGGEDTTRDVYQNKEDCQKDWGEDELCEQMNDDDSGEYRRTGGVFIGSSRPYWGPQYYPSDRTVIYKGRNISPTTKSSSMKSFVVTSRSSSSSKSSSASSPRSSSTSYSGFGGKSSGGGGGS